MEIKKLKEYKPTIFKGEQSYYDKDAADMAVNFINCLKHTKGEWFGKNFDLIDWQEQIIRDVFGTMKPNGYRRFNSAYIEIAKKQGMENKTLREVYLASQTRSYRKQRKTKQMVRMSSFFKKTEGPSFKVKQGSVSLYAAHSSAVGRLFKTFT